MTTPKRIIQISSNPQSGETANRKTPPRSGLRKGRAAALTLGLAGSALGGTFLLPNSTSTAPVPVSATKAPEVGHDQQIKPTHVKKLGNTATGHSIVKMETSPYQAKEIFQVVSTDQVTQDTITSMKDGVGGVAPDVKVTYGPGTKIYEVPADYSKAGDGSSDVFYQLRPHENLVITGLATTDNGWEAITLLHEDSNDPSKAENMLLWVQNGQGETVTSIPGSTRDTNDPIQNLTGPSLGFEGADMFAQNADGSRQSIGTAVIG